jgi:tRNA(adenine34) deaminase
MFRKVGFTKMKIQSNYELISIDEFDFMNEAYKEAVKAYKKGEVPIGAVIIKDNIVIAKAHNEREIKRDATLHAEMSCISKACKKLNTWRLNGCDMYVTL